MVRLKLPEAMAEALAEAEAAGKRGEVPVGCTIVDGRGTVHEVVGEGVVGEMPLIAPGASFDYVSGCPLDTPSGGMSGSYRMVDEDGTAFDVEIPRFQLLSA